VVGKGAFGNGLSLARRLGPMSSRHGSERVALGPPRRGVPVVCGFNISLNRTAVRRRDSSRGVVVAAGYFSRYA